ncbi:hypothetical protein [Rickettsia asiatica]|uniref:hypothetical protein n=1 Tax=Rickettsia asiatica TaxID=238800 RepID=UPI0002DAD19F
MIHIINVLYHILDLKSTGSYLAHWHCLKMVDIVIASDCKKRGNLAKIIKNSVNQNF